MLCPSARQPIQCQCRIAGVELQWSCRPEGLIDQRLDAVVLFPRRIYSSVDAVPRLLIRLAPVSAEGSVRSSYQSSAHGNSASTLPGLLVPVTSM